MSSNRAGVSQLVRKWDQIEGPMSTKEINDIYVKENMAVLLENQATKNPFGEINPYGTNHMLSEAGTNTLTTSTLTDTTGGAFRPMTLALVRRTFPVLFANKVVGVQAMSTPVGLAYALRFLYNNAGNPLREAAFNDVDIFSGFTGGLPGSNSYPSLSGTADVGVGTSATTGEAFQIAGTNLTKMPEILFRVDQTAITAITRKLAASFTLESAQDIRSMHGVDIEREMLAVLQYEIMAELDRELLQRMKTVAVDTSNGGAALTTINVSGSAFDGRWSQEKYANIITSIVKKANDIAVSTRRGAGNFVIVSSRVATALQAAGPQFARNTALVDASTTLAEVGTINGTITVFRDSYATTDYALVGYKGPGISDTGIVFSPYITGVTNRALAPNDFAPRIGVMSRYAITDSLLGAGRYYRLIAYTNLSTIVPG